jgi:hypothetical protein
LDTNTIKLILQAATLVTLVIGLWLTIRQLRLLKDSYVEQHDWNRRKAAQDAIESSLLRISEDTALLEAKFKIRTGTPDPISLKEIQEECKDPAVEEALRRRLNTLEGLAVGVNQGTLDEEIVKAGFESIFKRTHSFFKEYIEHRRHYIARAYRDFEILYESWEPEERPRRPQTGKR